jgi:hypothetical protein
MGADFVRHSCWMTLFFLEKRFQSGHGLFGPVIGSAAALCPPGDEIVAKVRPFFFNYALRHNLFAFIVCVLAVELALLAAAKILIATGACILSAYFSLDTYCLITKYTFHKIYASLKFPYDLSFRLSCVSYFDEVHGLLF